MGKISLYLMFALLLSFYIYPLSLLDSLFIFMNSFYEGL